MALIFKLIRSVQKTTLMPKVLVDVGYVLSKMDLKIQLDCTAKLGSLQGISSRSNGNSEREVIKI